MRTISRLLFLSLLFSTSALAESLQAAPGDYHQTIEVDGLPREYFVHVPPSYDGQSAFPLVLVFHGGLRDAQSTIQFVGMNDVADARGFIAVHPQGLPLPHSLSRRHLFWNCSYNRWNSDADDVHFTEAMLADLRATLRIDPRRIFSTGMSAGAQISYRLACRLSKQIAAIAAVSGSLETDPCEPERPVPVLELHGTADQFIPFDGGGRLGYQSVPDTISAWARINGCPTAPQVKDVPHTVNDGTSVQILTYGPCAQGSEVVLAKITGSGHNWPGIPLEDFPWLDGQRIIGRLNWRIQRNTLGRVTMQISSKDMIWDFFSRHPMPATP